MDNVVGKLIKSIKDAYSTLNKNGYDVEKEAVTLSHDSIFALINAVEAFEAAAPKWISVEERLPEDNSVFVLCAVKDGSETFVTEGWYLKRNGHISLLDEDYAFCDVTHWMPMPEPPEEGT